MERSVGGKKGEIKGRGRGRRISNCDSEGGGIRGQKLEVCRGEGIADGVCRLCDLCVLASRRRGGDKVWDEGEGDEEADGEGKGEVEGKGECEQEGENPRIYEGG